MLVADASPLSTLEGKLLPVRLGKIQARKVVFQLILEAETRPTFWSCFVGNLAIEHDFRQSFVVHANDMSCPPKLSLKQEGLNAADLATRQDLMICDPVLPRNVAYRSQLAEVEGVQHFDLPPVWGPGFTTI